MSSDLFQEPKDLEYDENITLFRYMDISLVYHLLQGQTYPLTCLRCFDDKKELPLLKELIKNINGNNTIGSEIVYDVYRGGTFGSSWSQNSHEMIDMWERYTNPITGVVIKTNAKRLYDAIPKKSIKFIDKANQPFYLPVSIKHVKYVNPSHIDYIKSLSQDVVEQIIPYSHYYKTVAYENENEVRIGHSVLTDKHLKKFMAYYDGAASTLFAKEMERGAYAIHLNVGNAIVNLIEEIRISPFSYPKFKKDVEYMIKGINAYREQQNKPTFDHINIGSSELL